MRERAFEILEAAIREFIETGEPVSSGQLHEEYDFGIRPAMIRAELSRLTDEGYLEQPYHSAGRIPSNRGYEFFAGRVFEEKQPQPRRGLKELLEERAYEDFLGRLTRELGVAGVIGSDAGMVKKEGLDALMEHLDWNSREAMMRVIRDFEEIDRHLSAARELLRKNFLEVWIGRKSPVTKSDDLAVIATEYDAGDAKVIVFAIGPKRMNYEKAAGILKGLKNNF